MGLFDAEHASSYGVEYYDIAYFIQRVFSVLENEELAQKILVRVLEKNYLRNNLKIVLAARVIGGFLDESLTPFPNYHQAYRFKDWAINL